MIQSRGYFAGLMRARSQAGPVGTFPTRKSGLVIPPGCANNWGYASLPSVRGASLRYMQLASENLKRFVSELRRAKISAAAVPAATRHLLYFLGSRGSTTRRLWIRPFAS